MNSFNRYVDYCNTIWTSTSLTNLEPINISMKKAVRIMTHSPPDNKCINYRQSIKIIKKY